MMSTKKCKERQQWNVKHRKEGKPVREGTHESNSKGRDPSFHETKTQERGPSTCERSHFDEAEYQEDEHPGRRRRTSALMQRGARESARSNERSKKLCICITNVKKKSTGQTHRRGMVQQEGKPIKKLNFERRRNGLLND